jgi:hypothetical protein
LGIVRRSTPHYPDLSLLSRHRGLAAGPSTHLPSGALLAESSRWGWTLLKPPRVSPDPFGAFFIWNRERKRMEPVNRYPGGDPDGKTF